MTQPDIEWVYLRKKVLDLLGIDIQQYKSRQMQRRLQSYLRRQKIASWPLFFHMAEKNPSLLEDLRAYLTINVTTFFRDPELWDLLRVRFLPQMAERRSILHVWSAGCSYGHEAYSLAILFSEYAQKRLFFRIWATDIDQAALHATKQGGPYSEKDLVNVPPNLRERYFREKNGAFWVIPRLRAYVRAEYHNLLSDPIDAAFDMIVCRNVVIYFDQQAKKTLYRRLALALRPQGLLFVGASESITTPEQYGLKPIAPAFYQRDPAL
ncbi:MAG: protein-glutamate O-methyltransferase CheR [Ardenticatenia bacterium]|nr:MAG: protein-glutamate O-methyltransferase CheR [Ardenticatenia bacterium]